MINYLAAIGLPLAILLAVALLRKRNKKNITALHLIVIAGINVGVIAIKLEIAGLIAFFDQVALLIGFFGKNNQSWEALRTAAKLGFLLVVGITLFWYSLDWLGVP